MSTTLVRTNLGKWGRATQTYEEHVHAVWVFRKPLLAVLYTCLRDILSRYGQSEGEIKSFWENDYLPFVHRETRWHDYDKLFVPEDRLAALSKFAWHGKSNDPVNAEALARVLQEDSEIAVGDRPVWAAVLRAANFAHEGLFTSGKAEALRASLASFGKHAGWLFQEADYRKLGNIHMATLRAADAIASAQDRPAFKDDVSRFTNIVAQFAPASTLRLVTISFETAFSQSSVSGVLSGYYRFYDAAYKGLETALSCCGHVVADNARTLVGIALTTDSPEALRTNWWSLTCNNLGTVPDATALLGNLLMFDVINIDMLAGPVDFDVALRNELGAALAKAHSAGAVEQGFPCGSCGRRVVTRPLEEAGSGLKSEVATPESRGDFGFARSVTRHVLGLETVIDKSKLLVCSACNQLAQLAGPNPLQATLVIGSYGRKYTRLPGGLQLTSSAGDALTQALYSFPLQQEVLTRLANTVNLAALESQRVAGSAFRIRFTPSLEGILRAFVDPVLQCVEPVETRLPDALLREAVEFGLRVGAGALFMGGRLHDTVYLPGVYFPDEYRARLQLAGRLHQILIKLEKREYERALYSLRTERNVAALSRRLLTSEDRIADILDGAAKPKLGLEEVLEAANLAATVPLAVEDLQRFRSAESD